MINSNEILETIRMIREEHFDVRTITMGISLKDCAHPDSPTACEKIYDKITHLARNLVQVAEDIETEFGVPIINKRIAVTPISLIAQTIEEDQFVEFAKTLDRAAEKVGINFIGGYSALVHKGYARGEMEFINSIPRALCETNRVCASVNIATTRTGINMNAVRQMGDIIRETALLSKEHNCMGCAKLVVFANAVEDNPFMAGAFHGVGEPECAINVGVSGPGVIKSALEKVKGESFDTVAETIKRTAFKITRVGQLVAREASRRLNAPFGIVDLSLAPTPAVGDSVARIIEEIGIDTCGGPGTTAALAMLTDAVKKGGVMASSHVGGLSGAFIPVSEDEGMIEAVQKGALRLEKLEAMTSVCSVGLDMIAVPGDTPSETLAAIIADEAAIGVINHKTTAVRIIPAIGKSVGDMVEFGGLLGSAPVMEVANLSSARFIDRGGRIPAPITGMRN